MIMVRRSRHNQRDRRKTARDAKRARVALPLPYDLNLADGPKGVI
jgi:hypothetical protein